jgi:hypothetical protein
MKNKMMTLAVAGMLTIAGLAFGFTSSQSQSCPLEGTPKCPKINCPLAGTPDCPYEKIDIKAFSCCKKK